MTTIATFDRPSVCEGNLPDVSHVTLLASLPPSARDRLARELHTFEVEAGQSVLEQDELSADLFLVLKGALVGLLLSDGGKEVFVSDFGPGSHFGEISAEHPRPSAITITATARSRLGRLSGEALKSWIAEEPSIAITLAADLSERNRALTERIYALVVHDVDKRVRTFLSTLARAREQLRPGGALVPAPTHEAMASRVGANREAVSRVISRLARHGVIEASRQRIVLKDVHTLLDGLDGASAQAAAMAGRRHRAGSWASSPSIPCGLSARPMVDPASHPLLEYPTQALEPP